MHGGGYDVIAGLALINVVIGMDQFFAALAAEQFNGAIGDDLVGIHIRRGAGAGLENIQDKFAVPFSIGHLLGRLDDGRGDLRFEAAQLLVGQGGVFFDQAKRADERAGKAQVADGKILDGPCRLRAIISGSGHLHWPHGIGFGAKRFIHNGNRMINSGSQRKKDCDCRSPIGFPFSAFDGRR